MVGDIIWGNQYAWGSPDAGLLPAVVSKTMAPSIIEQTSVTGVTTYELQGRGRRTLAINGTCAEGIGVDIMARLTELESLVETGFVGAVTLGRYNLGTYIGTSLNVNFVKIVGGTPIAVQWSLSLSQCAQGNEQEPADVIEFGGDNPINFEVT